MGCQLLAEVAPSWGRPGDGPTIEGAEDGADEIRGEAKGFGLLGQLDLSVTEGISCARGGKVLSHLGANLLKRQGYFRRD